MGTRIGPYEVTASLNHPNIAHIHGLEAAHEIGIVHRDLEPANIKVRADGTVMTRFNREAR